MDNTQFWAQHWLWAKDWLKANHYEIYIQLLEHIEVKKKD